ncbi:MAG: hypothetical protein A3G32_04425 [Deltaproteobacteria bacterium RIFCSPLOWO2_12_FULL_40_28]|nr:MAG: hypothetical protein A3C45_08535 [Deltaproteobacteria bacterium RIFCSPHIGHO2_02_FULL_40_28]OGQ19616.1 MAG: hypothetical protein A3E27_07730 [Deltaproteobacteria bacterium RIFCSPHIGHO2_12_FULL_40_32]OGQ40893.1 MAG: hypothetical protein A3I69_03145 [Deltaproteobacteria bacterium RIFCSPLOWO2_02_FULL_40_36]OGQ54008.1 MAG: hypothetical protein A3G32_04425 [Deltaproteobacteria bacterium RIFCSPLOWO2_12_FULL_40_28]
MNLNNQRKEEERSYHDLVRSDIVWEDPKLKAYYLSNGKFYSINRAQTNAVTKWWKDHLKDKVVLDYCCGDGRYALDMAPHDPKKIIGIDISEVSVEKSKRIIAQNGLSAFCEFQVMDAENTKFENSSFDIVNERGVLHHLDLEKAYCEIARVLKPDGKALCQEALIHNPLFQFYRRITPQLRTPWEADHILSKNKIYLAKKYFNKVEIIGFYSLMALFAVPFRNTRFFNFILSFLEPIDHVLFKLPGFKWLAWSAVFELSQPKKD